MGEKFESGFPHKTNTGTKYAHRRNRVSRVRNFVRWARNFPNDFQALNQSVAMPHRFGRKRCIYLQKSALIADLTCAAVAVPAMFCVAARVQEIKKIDCSWRSHRLVL
jgi:hypothetical protein